MIYLPIVGRFFMVNADRYTIHGSCGYSKVLPFIGHHLESLKSISFRWCFQILIYLFYTLLGEGAKFDKYFQTD